MALNTVLKNLPIHSGLPTKGIDYFNLTSDLSSINSPNKYGLVFFAGVSYLKGNLYCTIVDGTDWSSIPPPEYNVTASPSSLYLRQGEEKTVELQMKSAADFNSQVFLSKDVHGQEIQTQLIPNQTSIPANDLASSLLKIKASDDAGTHSYTIPITMKAYPNITTTEIATGVVIGNQSQSIPANKEIALTVNVLPKLSLVDIIKNIFSDWINPQTGVIGGIVAILTSLGWKIWNKHRD
jgi:hypothetical protein